MFAVLRALETARDRGFTRIKLRSDYNSMRRNLREGFRSGAAGENDLQQKILDLARQFESTLVISLDVERGNLLSRMLNAANTKMMGSPINISSNSLRLGFDELARALTTAFEKHRGAGRTNG